MNGDTNKLDIIKLETKFFNVEEKLDDIQKTLKEITKLLGTQRVDVELLKRDVTDLEKHFLNLKTDTDTKIESIKQEVKKNTKARWQAIGAAAVISFIAWFISNGITLLK